jgi:hypothetical protein
MRFISMHKADARSEACTPPPQKTIEGMGKLIGDLIAAGLFVNADGLLPSRRRVKLGFEGGRRTVTPGPFTGAQEIIAGATAIKVRTLDEAIEWATRIAEVSGDREIEVGPLTEAWDLGFGQQPADAPLRCLLLQKGDGGPLPAMKPILDEMRRAGVLLSSERLQPSRHARRVKYGGGKRTTLDGPFAEAKELIGGFIAFKAERIDDLMPWLDRFHACFHADALELDLYPLVD